MITVTRRLEWDAMHRIPLHESKCRAFHGHRYAAEITCTAPQLDDLGRVVDFGVIKQLVGSWIDDHWDHTAILMEGDEEAGPLAEANAKEIVGMLSSSRGDPTERAAEANRALSDMSSPFRVEVTDLGFTIGSEWKGERLALARL